MGFVRLFEDFQVATAGSGFAICRSSVVMLRAVFQVFRNFQRDAVAVFAGNQRCDGFHADPNLVCLAAEAGAEGDAVVFDREVGGRGWRDVQHQHFFLQEVRRYAVYPARAGGGDDEMRGAVVIDNPLVDGAQQVGFAVGHGDVVHHAPGRSAASCLESDLRKYSLLKWKSM